METLVLSSSLVITVVASSPTLSTTAGLDSSSTHYSHADFLVCFQPSIHGLEYVSAHNNRDKRVVISLLHSRLSIRGLETNSTLDAQETKALYYDLDQGAVALFSEVPFYIFIKLLSIYFLIFWEKGYDLVVDIKHFFEISQGIGRPTTTLTCR